MILAIADVRAHLGISGTSDDSYLELMERVCVADLEALSGEYYGEVAEVVDLLDVPRSTDSRLLRPVGAYASQALGLSRTPTADGILSARERESAEGDWAEVAVEELELSGREVRRLIGQWFEGESLAEITYESGFAAGELPPLAEGALLDMMAYAYKSAAVRSLSSAGIQSADVRDAKMVLRGGGAATGGPYPASVMARIDRLRRAWRFAA